MYGSQHKNDTTETVMPAEKDVQQGYQLPASEFDQISPVPFADVIHTQNMFVGDSSLPYPVVQGSGLHHGPQDSGLHNETQNTRLLNGSQNSGLHQGPQNSQLHQDPTYDFYNQSLEYGPSGVGQQSQMEFSEPWIRPVDSVVNVPALHRNENDIAGGDMHQYLKDTFQNELDRPVTNHFGSPINSLSLDYGGFNSPYHLGIDSTGSLDTNDIDLFLDDDLIQYFGA